MAKNGVDDYLVAGHTVEELRLLARKFEPSEITRIRISKDEKLQAAVQDLWQSWYEENWMDFAGRAERGNWMRGHGCRDTMNALIRIGARSGRVCNGDLIVSIGLRPLSEEAAKSHESTRRNILHLEASGWLEIIPPEDESKPRSYRLKAPRARVDTMVVGTGGKKVSTEVRPRCQPLRASSAPRLRWSSPARKKRREFELVPGRPVVRSTGAPARDDQEESPYIKRLGPHRGAVCDVLEASGGELHLEDLCEALHRKRPRDVRRRTLPMLEEVGVIEVDGDAVRLVRDWLDKLEEERERAGEIEQAERQAEKHRKRGIEYRAHLERQKRGTPQASYDYARRTKETRERRMREIAAEDARGLEPTPPEVRAFVEKMLNQHDRIRLGLLCEVAQDRGLRCRDVPVAVRRMGYRIERLPEYEDAEFVYGERVAA